MRTDFIDSGITVNNRNKKLGNTADIVNSGITVNRAITSSGLSNSTIDDLVRKESGGNYRAINPKSSATGKYQFLWNTWKEEIERVTGVKTREEFRNNPNAQDKFFRDYYIPNEAEPAIRRIKQATGTTEDEGKLFKLFHFRGEKGAKDYLKGNLSDTPEGADNMAISKYTGIPKKMALGGALSAIGAIQSITKPIADLVEGDGTSIARSSAAGFLQLGPIGALTKGFQTQQANKLRNEKELKNYNLDNINVKNQSNAIYKQIDLNPMGYYALGGNIKPSQYEAEKNEVVMGNPNLEESTEIAPGMHEVGGESHENGGTMGEGGDFVFSNKLNISKEDIAVLSTIGIKLSNSIPYSEAAKKLGKIASNFMTAGTRYREINTNKIMISRVQQALQMLAQSQESQKQ